MANANQLMTHTALNRATLARQMMLAREEVSPLAALERLVGLQAQEAQPPFIGFWSRIVDFQRDDFLKLVHRKKVVRATAMRCTLHLMSAKDFLKLRGALQPALTSAMQSALQSRAKGLDLDELIETAEAFFGADAATFDSFRDHLARLDSKVDARAAAYAVRTQVPLVQVPNDDTWGFPSAAKFTLAKAWLGETCSPRENTEELVRRYLAAFGPATAADVQTWSGLKGIAEVLEKLRSKLVVSEGPKKQELFDLPDAPRPGEDVEVPVRFLPAFDNLVLAHADRTRLISDEHRRRIVTANLRVLATFLVDGRVAGTWKIERKGNRAALLMDPFVKLSARAAAELSDEGDRLARFVEPDAGQVDVRIAGTSLVSPAANTKPKRSPKRTNG